MGDWAREFILGIRRLRDAPGTVATIALTIGLGVGANLAVFALLQDALLPASPYGNPERLVLIENKGAYFYGGA